MQRAADGYFYVDLSELPLIRIAFPARLSRHALGRLIDELAPAYRTPGLRYGLIDLSNMDPRRVGPLFRSEAARAAVHFARQHSGRIGGEACFSNSTVVQGIHRAYSWLTHDDVERRMFKSEMTARSWIATRRHQLEAA